MTDTRKDADKSAAHSAKKGLAFAHIAFIGSVLAALYLLLVMMITHLGYVSDEVGFKVLTLNYGPKVAMAALVLSGLSLLIAMFMAPGRTAIWALGAVVIAGGIMGGFFAYQKALRTFPPISDVATDWDRPLSFSEKMIADRGKDSVEVEDLPRVPRNESMEWGGKTIADINQTTCPGAHTVMNKAVTADQIADLLKAQHYTVFGTAPWRVEATYQDNFYGFQSDVVVRIDPRSIDVRSIGRYDLPDLGGNCRRVTRLVKAIREM